MQNNKMKIAPENVKTCKIYACGQNLLNLIQLINQMFANRRKN